MIIHNCFNQIHRLLKLTLLRIYSYFYRFYFHIFKCHITMADATI